MKNIVKLLNGLELLHPDITTIAQLKRTLSMFPATENALTDAYSVGQIQSKQWLINHLPEHLGLVFICAGWYGTLASFIFEKCPEKIKAIRSFDIDEQCCGVADNLNRPWVMDGWKFKATTLDIMELEYPMMYVTLRANGSGVTLTEMPDTIINTSCEHIQDFNAWYDKIPAGVLVVLQSNNFFEIEDHVNCSNDVDEFDAATPMSTTLFLGEKELPKYTRFMKIGYK